MSSINVGDFKSLLCLANESFNLTVNVLTPGQGQDTARHGDAWGVGGGGGGGRGGGWAVMGECKGLLVTLALGPHLSNNLSHKKDLSQLIIQL